MDVTVVVATFGDVSWCDLADQRAIPSAEAHGVPVIHSHGNDITDARNHGLSLVETEWVCFLDADDELGRRYFDQMALGTADVRAPACVAIVATLLALSLTSRVASVTASITPFICRSNSAARFSRATLRSTSRCSFALSC